MAIAKMDHFNLYVLKSDLDKAMTLIQNSGDVHLIKISDDEELLSNGLEVLEHPQELEYVEDRLKSLDEVINLLSSYKSSLKAVESMKKGKTDYTFDEIMEKGTSLNYKNQCEEILKIKADMDEIERKISDLKEEKEFYKPWKKLKLNPKTLANSSNVEYITGYIPTRRYYDLKKEIEDLEYSYIEKIEDYDGFSYLLAITLKEEKKELEAILSQEPFYSVKLELDDMPANEVIRTEIEIKKLKVELEALEDQLKDYLPILENLKLKYEYFLQLKVKYEGSENLLKTDRVCVVEGYVKTKKSADFVNHLDYILGNGYNIDIKEADINDPKVPTELENGKIIKNFEFLTEMYAIPRYNEIDPTPFLAPFFGTFFGMMLADFGYGLLLFLGTLIMLKKFNLSDSMRKNIKFFNYMSIFTMFWGFIYGSFFSGIIPMKPIIDPAEDYMKVIIISIALGGIHMFLGMGIKAYMLIRDGKPMDAVYDVLFWYMALLGAIYMAVSSVIGLPGGNIAKIIMIIGMIGIVLFGGRESESIAGRAASGAYELYGITSWVGDFISYIRLMALGLSGSFIGVAFNLIGQTVTGGGNIAMIIFGSLIIIIGHLFNMLLSLLSAYVHTLRLTFVEFFGKFYDGGGIKFKKLRNEQPKFINIRNQEE